MIETAPLGTFGDQQYINLLEDVRFRPIFIMGDHRSGTTILYRLLDATQCFNVVRAYHLSRYDEIIMNHLQETEQAAKEQLSSYLLRMGLTNRIIDGVEVTPDLPEEYGFILKDAGFRLQLTPRSLPKFVELCKKVQFVSDPAKPLLLKNPWDYFLNFMYVKRAFPDAKFIFIHRHPLHVINSQLKAVRASLGTRSAYNDLIAEWYRQIYRKPVRRTAIRLLFSPHFVLGVRIVTRHVVRGITYFMRHVNDLPSSDHISLRYEDVCADPKSAVKQVLNFLGLEERDRVAYETFIEPRPLRLLPEVARECEKVRQKLGIYYERYGYDAVEI